jgi:hypothetical protein
MYDLVLLVADKNAEYALRGALGRPESLGIRAIGFKIVVHPGRDGGARTTGAEVLARERRRFRQALLILDYEGSGTDLPSGLALESELDKQLQLQWGAAAKSIVIEPELDIWVWGSDNAIEAALEWPSPKRLREWLAEKGFVLNEHGKPILPKEALQAALSVPDLPRSSALYRRIAERISLHRCGDEAFIRLRAQLREWFGA